MSSLSTNLTLFKILKKIENEEDYDCCVWYIKKTNKFCDKKVSYKKSHHYKWNIFYCDACCKKSKENDLIKILKNNENINCGDDCIGILKVEGAPILKE